MSIRGNVILAVSFLIGVVCGGMGGATWTRRVVIRNEFPRSIQLGLITKDVMRSAPPETTLQLLDIYEGEVRRQMSIGWKEEFWKQALVNIALQRHLVYSAQGRDQLAHEMLERAALISAPADSPSPEKIEFFRQTALRTYKK